MIGLHEFGKARSIQRWQVQELLILLHPANVALSHDLSTR
jgi:hypothetical protein